MYQYNIYIDILYSCLFLYIIYLYITRVLALGHWGRHRSPCEVPGPPAGLKLVLLGYSRPPIQYPGPQTLGCLGSHEALGSQD